MNDRQQANRLLDQHKETRQLSYADTTAALRATGDYEDDGGEGVDFEIQEEISGDWRGSFWLVVADIARYGEKKRSTSSQ